MFQSNAWGDNSWWIQTDFFFLENTWRPSSTGLVLGSPRAFFGFHLRLCGLILCGLRVWNKKKKIGAVKWAKDGRIRRGWTPRGASPGKKVEMMWRFLGSTGFDGFRKVSRTSPRGEINGLKLEHVGGVEWNVTGDQSMYEKLWIWYF